MFLVHCWTYTGTLSGCVDPLVYISFDIWPYFRDNANKCVYSAPYIAVRSSPNFPRASVIVCLTYCSAAFEN